MIFVGKFRRPRKPVVEISCVWMTVPIRIADTHMSGPIKRCVARILHVGIKRAAAVEKEIVFCPVRGETEMQTFPANGPRKFADDVAMRSHFRGAPVG